MKGWNMKKKFRKPARFNRFKPQKMPKITDSNWFPAYPMTDVEILAVRAIRNDIQKTGKEEKLD